MGLNQVYNFVSFNNSLISDRKKLGKKIPVKKDQAWAGGWGGPKWNFYGIFSRYFPKQRCAWINMEEF